MSYLYSFFIVGNTIVKAAIDNYPEKCYSKNNLTS